MDLLKQFVEHINNVLDTAEGISGSIMDDTGIGSKEMLPMMTNYAKEAVSLAYKQFVRELNEPAPQETTSDVDYSDIQDSSDDQKFLDKLKEEANIDGGMMVVTDTTRSILTFYTSEPTRLKEVIMKHQNLVNLVFPKFDYFSIIPAHVLIKGKEKFDNE